MSATAEDIRACPRPMWCCSGRAKETRGCEAGPCDRLDQHIAAFGRGKPGRPVIALFNQERIAARRPGLPPGKNQDCGRRIHLLAVLSVSGDFFGAGIVGLI